LALRANCMQLDPDPGGGTATMTTSEIWHFSLKICRAEGYSDLGLDMIRIFRSFRYWLNPVSKQTESDVVYL
jgi:hypothetical protein